MPLVRRPAAEASVSHQRETVSSSADRRKRTRDVLKCDGGGYLPDRLQAKETFWQQKQQQHVNHVSLAFRVECR